MAKVTKASIEADEMRKFRIKLNALIEKEGDDTKFSAKIGVSRQSVGFWKNGPRVPDAYSLMKIATECGVSVDWLLGVTDDNNWSPDETVKEVSSYTGLSTEAVIKLHRWTEIGSVMQSWIDMISEIIDEQTDYGAPNRKRMNIIWYLFLYLMADTNQFELIDPRAEITEFGNKLDKSLGVFKSGQLKMRAGQIDLILDGYQVLESIKGLLQQDIDRYRRKIQSRPGDNTDTVESKESRSDEEILKEVYAAFDKVNPAKS